MLRHIKHPHLNPRLIGSAFTTLAAPAIQAQFGSIDFASPGSYARAAAGEATLVFGKPFQQVPIQVCSVGPSGGLGGYAVNKQIPTALGSSLQYRDATGTAAGAEATLYALTCGWDAATTNLVPHQRLMCSRKKVRLFGCQVNTATNGTVVIGSNMFKSIVRTGTGDVTLTFRRPFQKTPVCVATVLNAAGAVRSAQIKAVAVDSVRVTIGDGSDVAQDGIFELFVYGTDYAAREGSSFRHVLQGCQRKETFLAGRVVVAASAITSTVGDCTAVRNGTGDFTFTLPTGRPIADFKREPIVIASSDTRLVVLKAISVTSFQALTFNNGSAADPGSLSYMLLGCKTYSEFGGY